MPYVVVGRGLIKTVGIKNYHFCCINNLLLSAANVDRRMMQGLRMLLGATWITLPSFCPYRDA